MRVLGRMVYYYCAARNLKKSAFEEPEERDEKKAKKQEQRGAKKKKKKKKNRHKKNGGLPRVATKESRKRDLNLMESFSKSPPGKGDNLSTSPSWRYVRIYYYYSFPFLRGALFAPFSF